MVKKSAGGLVFYGNGVLMLKKANGNWVLPKGKIEPSEKKSEAALREVKEETGVEAKILEFIGSVRYRYKDCYKEGDFVDKIVYWYIMKWVGSDLKPQIEEGFVKAKFIHVSSAASYLRYDDEKKIMQKALEIYVGKYY